MSEEQPIPPPESEETVGPRESSTPATNDDAAIDREMARKRLVRAQAAVVRIAGGGKVEAGDD